MGKKRRVKLKIKQLKQTSIKSEDKYEGRKDINGNPMPYHYLDNVPDSPFQSSGSDPWSILDN